VDYAISIFVNGIVQGSIYALMALGYSVIVGITGLVTFTHGEVIMMGAFASFYVFELFGNNILIGAVGSFIVCGILGIIIYKVCYERFLAAPRHIALICTIGASMMIKNLAQIVFGPNQKPMMGIVKNQLVKIGPVQLSVLQLVILAIVLILALGLSLFFSKTKYGVAMRAVSQDKTAASLMGLNVNANVLLGNIIGCGLAGVAGMLISVYYQAFQATMGGPLGMKAFSASVLGGLTDSRFAALGGLFLGIIENFGIAVSSASFRDIFAFIFLILILILKPQGFSKKGGIKL